MDAEVAVVGGAVEAEVDAKGDRSPCWVLLAAVEADLLQGRAVSFLDLWEPLIAWAYTLLAGFALSFSKSLSDCCFVARPLILSGVR